jgi:anti-sigma B factor antagonist
MQNYASTRLAGNIAIVDLGGGITSGETASLLRNKIKELTAAGHKNVLLNLRDVTYVDSAGMGEMVAACTTLRNLGGDLKLVNPQERVTYLLRVTKLTTIFDILADESAALQRFGSVP